MKNIGKFIMFLIVGFIGSLVMALILIGQLFIHVTYWLWSFRQLFKGKPEAKEPEYKTSKIKIDGKDITLLYNPDINWPELREKYKDVGWPDEVRQLFALYSKRAIKARRFPTDRNLIS